MRCTENRLQGTKKVNGVSRLAACEPHPARDHEELAPRNYFVYLLPATFMLTLQ